MIAAADLSDAFTQALRRLRRDRRFTVAFVVTLALGIAANAAVFPVLDAYVLHPLPYPHPRRLVNVSLTVAQFSIPPGFITAPAYLHLRKVPALADAGMITNYVEPATAVVRGTPHSLPTAWVTASMLATLGVQPRLGGFFGDTSDRPGGPLEAVLGYRLWQSGFAGSSDAIGSTIRINGKQYTVAGVMPRGFAFPNRRIALWLPIVLRPPELRLRRLDNTFNWSMIARMRPGTSVAQLRAQLAAELSRLKARAGLKPRAATVHVSSLQAWLGGATAERLAIVQLGALALLLLALASLANLSLVRTLRHREEAAVRVVLGAGRRQLLGSAVLEAVPLALVATLLAWPLAQVGTHAFVHFGVASQATAFRLGGGIETWVIAAALAFIVSFATLAVPTLFLPARRPATLLYGGDLGKGSARGPQRVRKGLSVIQIALAVMLLAGASLLGLSLGRILHSTHGLGARSLDVATLYLHGPRDKNWSTRREARERLCQAVARIPGVRAAAIGIGVPFTGGGSGNGFLPVVNSAPGKTAYSARMTLAGPRLLRTLGAKLVAGRLLDASDVASGADNVVIDEQFAEHAFGQTDVVGRGLAGNGIRWRIVGVVRTIADQFAPAYSFGDGTVFVADSKTTEDFWGGATALLVRSSRPLPILKRELRHTLRQTLPGQSFNRIARMRTLIADAANGASALANLLVAFGLLAFVLASVGTYAVVAYVSALRGREFAIRQSLGASPTLIQWLVLAQGFALWSLGTIAGVALALLFARFLRGQLFGVGLLTPGPYLVPALVLGTVVTLASWLPARHARRADLIARLRPD